MTDEQMIPRSEPVAASTIKPEANQQTKKNDPSLAQALPLASIVELTQKTWPVYKTNFKKIISLLLLPLLAFIVSGAIVLAVGGVLYFLRNSLGDTKIVFYVLMAIIGLVCLFFVILVAIVAQAGIYIVIRDSKENITFKEALLRAKKIAKEYFLLNLLVGIFTLLWMLLFVIPGIYMSIAYSMAIWIFVYEGIGGTAAIKKSKELVKGYWWPIVWRFLGIYIFLYAIMYLPTLFMNSGAERLWGFASQIISFVVTPFFMIYHCYIYWELKRVKNM